LLENNSVVLRSRLVGGSAQAWWYI